MARITKTIEQLRKELDAKERRLGSLQANRDRAAAQLEAIDSEIAELIGGAAGRRRVTRKKKEAVRRGRRPGRPATKKKAMKVKKVKKAKKAKKFGVVRRGRRGRRATGKPLAEYIRDVLATAPQGMRARDIATAVQQAGYQSFSKDFYGLVAKTLLTDPTFKRVSRGVYRF